MPIPKSVQDARVYLANNYGYLHALLWAMKPIEVPRLGTFGVDAKWHFYYDPEIDKKWGEAEVLGVLFHECNHILRKHSTKDRAAPFMHCTPVNLGCEKCQDAAKRFNICCDLEINPGILKLGFKLPVEGQFPAAYGLPDGLLAEEYWHRLPQGLSQQAPGPGAGACGGIAGHPEEHEQPDSGNSRGGVDQSDDAMSDADRELIIRDVAKKIEEAQKQGCGNIPAGLERWAQDYLHPKVSWRKELRSIAQRNVNECLGRRDYTFRRPNRRQGYQRVIMPSMQDYLPLVGIIRDTSGSMNTTDLQRTLAETGGILKAIGGRVIDIEVDCAVHTVKKVGSTRAIKLQGGGGTDMGVGINHAATLRPRLSVCVVMTDGETPWPTSPPPFKCIVLLTRQTSAKSVPAWAKTIVVND